MSYTIAKLEKDLRELREKLETEPNKNARKRLRDRIKSTEGTRQWVKRCDELAEGDRVISEDERIGIVQSIVATDGLPALYVDFGRSYPEPTDPPKMWSRAQIERRRQELTEAMLDTPTKKQKEAIADEVEKLKRLDCRLSLEDADPGNAVEQIDAPGTDNPDNPTENDWSELDSKPICDRLKNDERVVKDCKGWQVFVGRSDDGITDVSVIKGVGLDYCGYGLYTEGIWNKDTDLDWHIEIAKRQIDRLCESEEAPGQMKLDLNAPNEHHLAKCEGDKPDPMENANDRDRPPVPQRQKSTDGHPFPHGTYVFGRDPNTEKEGIYKYLHRGFEKATVRLAWSHDEEEVGDAHELRPLDGTVPDWYSYAVIGSELVRVESIEGGLIYVNHPHWDSGASHAIEEVLPLHLRFANLDDAGDVGIAVPIEWIERSVELQPRDYLSEEAIRSYAEMLETSEAPPVDIVIVGDRRYLAHGNHRYKVYCRAGRPTIRAKVRFGTFAEAVALAMTANGKNGRYGVPLKRLEAREAVARFLESLPDLPESDPRREWSNVTIAHECGSSEGTVRNIKCEFETLRLAEASGLRAGDRVEVIRIDPVPSYRGSNKVAVGQTGEVTQKGKIGITIHLDPLYGAAYVVAHPTWISPTERPEAKYVPFVGDVVAHPTYGRGVVVALEEPKEVRGFYNVSPDAPVVKFDNGEKPCDSFRLNPTGDREEVTTFSRIAALKRQLVNLPEGAASDRIHRDIERTIRYLTMGSPERPESEKDPEPRNLRAEEVKTDDEPESEADRVGAWLSTATPNALAEMVRRLDDTTLSALSQRIDIERTGRLREGVA
ncbi:MAG: ParB N-terminal domain-containing protein [Cyanobacteria bacterium SBC]|nr:ParB N-terminal domain-containing protein [Cyanobacteria bacterium SBC]